MQRAGIHVIGDRDTVMGLHLAGVGGTVVDDRDEARQALDAALADDDLRLLLVTRPWAERLAPRVDDLLHASDRPLVMEIPGPAAEPAAVSIETILRRAIGMGPAQSPEEA